MASSIRPRRAPLRARSRAARLAPRLGRALALAVALPGTALAQVAPAPGVVEVPRTVDVQPVPPALRPPLHAVTPPVPAYPRYPAYSTYAMPDRVIIIDSAIPPPAPLSQDDYLREMARRWDPADIAGLGITPQEMSNLTGRVDTNALAPITGIGGEPGNMGPGSLRGQ